VEVLSRIRFENNRGQALCGRAWHYAKSFGVFENDKNLRIFIKIRDFGNTKNTIYIWRPFFMHRLQDLLGLPLLETETGTQIGQIKDVVLHIEEARVYGVTIDEEKQKAFEMGIAYVDLLSVGRDAVMVRNHSVMHQCASIFEITSNYYVKELFKKEIITEDGLRLGILVDIFFDTSTGEMKWYQISDSLVSDLLYGRRIMPLPKIQIVGKDTVIVPGEMAKLLHKEE
jgi:uncharacterized protein YrrD